MSSLPENLAILFAKLSRYKVLTTRSPRNFDFVKRIGVDAAFIYNDIGSVSTIKLLKTDGWKLAFDTIPSKASTSYCDQALSSDGGDYTVLLSIPTGRENSIPIYHIPACVSSAIGWTARDSNNYWGASRAGIPSKTCTYRYLVFTSALSVDLYPCFP